MVNSEMSNNNPFLLYEGRICDEQYHSHLELPKHRTGIADLHDSMTDEASEAVLCYPCLMYVLHSISDICASRNQGIGPIPAGQCSDGI